MTLSRLDAFPGEEFVRCDSNFYRKILKRKWDQIKVRIIDNIHIFSIFIYFYYKTVHEFKKIKGEWKINKYEKFYI